ncbi:hypothetical protein KUV51_11530 [Tateyamaria omphalii]|uniref:hypothetical protein n=1 Tax=Tateyamaria omphalii TaxID=299262 RepID=UPI001C993882|nr:hypothetical protein [Tateyamaria omphalii]MBY5933632.1 hypothetical protein [Tateyamaria omphalii]
MRTLASLILWIISSSFAISAEITVRSGAHENFSRLVLDVATGTQWSVEQDSLGARVRIVDHENGFETSSIFEKIDRTFIDAVSASSDTIEIVFNCQCRAEVFWAGNRMVVIDVGRQNLKPENSIEEASFPSSLFTGSTPLRFAPRAPKKEPSENTTVQVSQIVASDSRTISVEMPTVIEPRIDRQESNPAKLQRAQEKLAERIGEAATTGVLNPSRKPWLIYEQERRAQIDTRIFDSSRSQSEATESMRSASVNLRITSSHDVPTETSRQNQASTTFGFGCVDPSKVRIQDWASEADFAQQLAVLRKNLYSEFDKLNTKVALDLARLYLHFGFGPEARQVLRMNAELWSENPALIDIADILELGDRKVDGYLANYLDCDSEAALWAILSSSSLHPSDSVNNLAAIRTLSSLPIHLRRHLAPILSRKLLDYGDEDGAASALRGLERTSEPLTSPAELAKAEIELVQGKVETAQSRLEDVVASNDQQSAEALVRYVDTQFEAGVAISNDVATLVEAYAIEFRDDPLGDELRRTHVLALAKSNQFDEAFSALDRIRSTKMKNTADTLRSTVLEALSLDADDSTFVRHAFANMPNRASELSLSSVLMLADRLADLGFFSEAEQVMFSQRDVPQTVRNKLLRAKISLGLSRPQEALAVLRGLDGKEAARLRAAASSQAGDHTNAYEVFSQLEDETHSLQAAWLSDEWKTLLSRDAPTFGPTLEIASSQLNTSTDLEGMLGRLERALNESEESRDVIKQLLDANMDDVATREN